MGYPAYVSTTNACRMCTPLGACIAFKGVEGAVPFLHGSQGCATYMRRYIISHFREPIDVASSALGEKQAVYGGSANLKQGLLNIIEKYSPRLVGIATTCLTETIGDDVKSILGEFVKEQSAKGSSTLPKLVRVATPSYQGSHIEGFHATVRALVEQLVVGESSAEKPAGAINLFPGLVSPADIRHLVEIVEDFGLIPTVLPDYSDTLDGPATQEYAPIAPGGTAVEQIVAMGLNPHSLEFGATLKEGKTAASLLEKRHGVERIGLGLPIGLRESDRLFQELERVAGTPTPRRHTMERGRLVDALVDGHKYLSGKRAVVFGDEDLVIGLASFLSEIGIKPLLCATGGKSGRFKEAIESVTSGLVREEMTVLDGVDFHEIAHEAKGCAPDLVIGNSKGFHLAKALDIPLVRVGFPIHDRFGGQRQLHVGYRGAQALYDQIVNTIIDRKQSSSPVGYSYL